MREQGVEMTADERRTLEEVRDHGPYDHTALWAHIALAEIERLEAVNRVQGTYEPKGERQRRAEQAPALAETGTASMSEYRFTILLTNCEMGKREATDALNAFGVKDFGISHPNAMWDRKTTIHFMRQGSSLGAVLRTAVEQVQRAQIGRIASITIAE